MLAAFSTKHKLDNYELNECSTKIIELQQVTNYICNKETVTQKPQN